MERIPIGIRSVGIPCAHHDDDDDDDDDDVLSLILATTLSTSSSSVACLSLPGRTCNRPSLFGISSSCRYFVEFWKHEGGQLSCG